MLDDVSLHKNSLKSSQNILLHDRLDKAIVVKVYLSQGILDLPPFVSSNYFLVIDKHVVIENIDLRKRRMKMIHLVFGMQRNSDLKINLRSWIPLYSLNFEI